MEGWDYPLVSPYISLDEVGVGDQAVYTRFRPHSRNNDNRAEALQPDVGALSKSRQSGVGTLEFSSRSQTLIFILSIRLLRMPLFSDIRR